MSFTGDRDPLRLTRRSICGGGFALLLSKAVAGQTKQPAAPPPATQPSATKLAGIRAQADGLMQRAVRTTAGWGWADEEPGVDLTRGRHPRGKTYTVSASLTANAGLLLDLAGDVCRDPSYHAAAVEAGHGVASLQTRAGQIRGKGVMGVLTALREDSAELPDRSATRAALALLLHLLDNTPAGQDPDPRIRTGALRAAHWLGKQENHSGGIATLYPPDAPPEKTTKIIRLDTPDVRDTLLAMLLASDVLGDQQLENYVDRAIDFLIPLRLFAGRPLRRTMWASAYRQDGDVNTRIMAFPPIPDLLATRRMIEVLLGAHLIIQKGKYADAMKETRDSVAALEKTPTGDWYRRYDLVLHPYQPAATQPAGVFTPALPENDVPNLQIGATPLRIDRVLAISSKAFRDEMAREMPIRRRIELMIAGLTDESMVSDLKPTNASRSLALVGTGGLAATLDAMWYELRTTQ